jgi:putative methionine-R-sulfoxide reductase with GAF domain
MHGFPQSERRSEDRFSSSGPPDTDAGSRQISSGSGVAGASQRNRALNEPELESALQLLVERAQYITGATGTALALPQGDEMVCRASAGSSAPAVGARLQVVSGLTGESIARRQLLRCDNAETDPRVNLEACRSLGIASIVVLPLFRKNGEVRGLIELFSDHPYAFEERDLVALERMADLTLTALDLAEQSEGAVQVTAPTRREIETSVEVADADADANANERPVREGFVVPQLEEFVEPRNLITDSLVTSSSTPVVVPEATRRKQKCASCGFPVSEGRTLCLDCEKKNKIETGRRPEQEQASADKWLVEPLSDDKSSREQSLGEQSLGANGTSEEFVPAFLVNASVEKESWLSNHVILLAIIVLILVVLVAVVILR